MKKIFKTSLFALQLVFASSLFAGVPDIKSILQVQKHFTPAFVSQAYSQINATENTLEVFATLQLGSVCAEAVIGQTWTTKNDGTYRLDLQVIAVSDTRVACIEILPPAEEYSLISFSLDLNPVSEIYVNGIRAK